MEKSSREKPDIAEQGSVADYLSKIVAWNKSRDPLFSLRNAAHRSGLSHTTLSRLAKGTRKLTVDIVPAVASALKLNRQEEIYLERWVRTSRSRQNLSLLQNRPGPSDGQTHKRPVRNHLLNDWLNVYIRDAAKLAIFKPDCHDLFRLLNQIASPNRIQRSLNFLFREGFLRRTTENKVVLDEPFVTTTDGVPNNKIKLLHRNALAIAQAGLATFAVGERSQNTLIFHLNKEGFNDLQVLLQEFYERLIQFAEAHPHGNERLYQIILNVTPLSIQREGETSK